MIARTRGLAARPTSTFPVLLAALLLLTVSADARAVSVNHGDCFDNINGSVVYEQVTENTADPAEFRAPTCIANDIDFDPIGFVATSSGGIVTATGAVTFTIAANQDYVVTDVLFNEGGDYTLVGVGVSSVDAEMNINVEITETTLGPVSESALQAPSFTSTLPCVACANIPWSINTFFSFDQMLVDAGFDPAVQATRVDVTITNTMTADVAAGDFGTIFKSEVGGLSITAMAQPIPEPSTGLLLGLGLSGLALLRRRSRAH